MSKMSKIILIGLAGKAGSGKNTSADSPAFSGYEQLAFADPIKKIAKQMFHLNDKQLYDNIEKEKVILDESGKPLWHINGEPASPRLMFQWLGTKMRTDISKEYFLMSMNEEIKKRKDLNEYPIGINCRKRFRGPRTIKIIITDVRYPNEAEYIRKLGGTVIKIERPTVITTTAHVNHDSEKDLPEYLIDHIVINNDSLKVLHQKLKNIVNKL